MGTEIQIHSVSDIGQMAQAIAASGLFGLKTKEQAFALMLIAQAEGRHPAAAARDYHIIQGRPALRADTMLSRFLEAGGTVDWHEYTDTQVSATFSHPRGGTMRFSWSLDDAKRAGVMGNDTWKKYPRAMLRARLISEAVRTLYPNVLSGMYTPEEVQDMEPRTRVHVIEGGPVEEAPKPGPDPRVAQLRRELAQASKALGLSSDDLREWIVGNYGDESAARDPTLLGEMIAALSGMREPAQGAQAEEAAA